MVTTQPEWVKAEWLANRQELVAEGRSFNSEWLKKRRELAAYSRVLLQIGQSDLNKFVVFGQGRTGSELLVSLLNNHPGIHCEYEILNADASAKLAFPVMYVQGRRAKYPNAVYGFKVKIYQLTEDQYIDPERFMVDLSKRGWKIIFLRRENLLRNSISCLLSFQRDRWHDKSENPLKDRQFTITWDRLLYELERRDIYAEKEEEILGKMEHIKIVYEQDLFLAENHQATCNRVFEYLGLPSVRVKTKLRKTTPNQMSDFIKNYEEIERAISQTKYAKYLSY